MKGFFKCIFWKEGKIWHHIQGAKYHTLTSVTRSCDKSGCMLDYISIPTGGYQYLQLGYRYFLLCTSVNKKMIFIIITIIIIIIIIIINIIIIIIIIIIMKSGAPLLGLPKSIYYISHSLAIALV